MKKVLLTILTLLIISCSAWAVSLSDIVSCPEDYVGKTFTYDVGITSGLVGKVNNGEFSGFLANIYVFELDEYFGNYKAFIPDILNFFFSKEDGRKLKKQYSYKKRYRITFKIIDADDNWKVYYIAKVSKVTEL